MAKIEQSVEEVLTPIITDLGYLVYDVEYVKEGKDYYLRIYIDKSDGIDINDCEKVTNVINPILDAEDYIKDKYFLEVSSSGLERNLRKPEHFEMFINKEIALKLFKSINGTKELIGILKEYNKDFLILEINNEKLKIDCQNIAAAKSVYNW